ESDIVITGTADCGSCTAYSVYDGIELEKAGRPTVVVTTTEFQPIAKTMAEHFGLPELRLVVLPHPIGGTPPDTLSRWADAVVAPPISKKVGEPRDPLSAEVVPTGDTARLREREIPMRRFDRVLDAGAGVHEPAARVVEQQEVGVAIGPAHRRAPSHEPGSQSSDREWALGDGAEGVADGNAPDVSRDGASALRRLPFVLFEQRMHLAVGVTRFGYVAVLAGDAVLRAIEAHDR